MFQFWGSTVLPNATPSETCIPHRLSITQASLEANGGKELKPGTRVAVYGIIKTRGKRGAKESQRFLVAALTAGQKETTRIMVSLDASTLVCFQVVPNSGCAVHLCGYFDNKFDKKPQLPDARTQIMMEVQRLLAEARQREGGSDDDEDDDDDDFEASDDEENSDSEGDGSEEDSDADDDDNPSGKQADANMAADEGEDEDDEEDDEDFVPDDDELAAAAKPAPITRAKAAERSQPPPKRGAKSQERAAPAQRVRQLEDVATGADEAEITTRSKKRKADDQADAPAKSTPTPAPASPAAALAAAAPAVVPKGIRVDAPPQLRADGTLQTADVELGVGKRAGVGDTVQLEVRAAAGGGRRGDGAAAAGGGAADARKKAGGNKAETVTFIAGLHNVCEGLERAALGMRVGGRRRVDIPPHLHTAPIPGVDAAPGAAVRVEVRLLRVR